MKHFTWLGILALALGASPLQAADPSEINRTLGRGVNLGNALEAPSEGEWGMTLQAEYFDLSKEAGFDSVRIPIRWSAHAEAEPPYTIDSEFFERVDWAIDQALSRGLAAVINIHHYEEFDCDPEGELPRFLALWRQIGERYQDQPEQLVFELMNEPHDNLTDDIWNRIVPQALAVVRERNPDRIVIVGPASWNSVDHLERLELPEDDRKLIATFHYYKPFQFTHQGASWVSNSDPWIGTTWTGTPEQLAELRDDFAKAAAWGKEHDRPIYVGEFGAYSRADLDSRARWTAAVVQEAQKHGFSFAYWEFGAGFGVYDREAGSWNEPLRDALLAAPSR